LSNSYGYVDSKGIIIIEAKFEEAYKFENDHAQIKLDGKYGTINEKGEFVIYPSYDFMSYLCSNHAIVKLDSFAIIDINDSIIFKFDYIPLCQEFITEKIYETQFENDTLLRRIITMYSQPLRPDSYKKKSKAIIEMSSCSQYISCILTNYILNNFEQIKKDIILDRKRDAQLIEDLKTGKYSWE